MGMTRLFVLQLCADTDLRAVERLMPTDQACAADEMFITSTAGGFMPVVRLDDCSIGVGVLGPITMRLREVFWQRREAGWHGTPVIY